MRIEREIVRLQKLRSLAVGHVIEQDGSENRAFRRYIFREGARETVVGSSHGYFLKCEWHTSDDSLVDEKEISEKLFEFTFVNLEFVLV